ncbi:hypothetical protein QMK19_30505 [Streptomyces sp. H10-C2]|uniref:DUF6907 domain-containing protein n=1 Tax=unclassified Streptomyces TaxID=2593676 RepID=UPI0024BAB92D|nr:MULTISPECIES: hypothetical protein [unclassified Streptomyces]MDJ0345968.1 hypothetical protein [Streptomyces sp. PH10-H1]MDJ0373865.1 hypothetical protein [Streptomyces sp. H10-C2]
MTTTVENPVNLTGDEPIPYTLNVSLAKAFAAITAPRTWTFTVPAWCNFHAELTQVCPTFCTDDHASDIDTPTPPSDICHGQFIDGCIVQLTDSNQPTEPWGVLSGHLQVSPYSTDPRDRVPHVSVELVQEIWTDALNPEQLAELIEKLAGRVENLRHVHAELVAAVAEWEARR